MAALCHRYTGGARCRGPRQAKPLIEQNARIAEQTPLLSQDVQLAKAARIAKLAVEITQTAAEPGQVLHRVAADYQASVGKPMEALFNAIQTRDLSRALILPITSVSPATRPYRLLDLGVRAQAIRDRTRSAVQRRQAGLPDTCARIGGSSGWIEGWTEPDADARLIDRPASPDRGQLLSVLLGAGLFNLRSLNVNPPMSTRANGADFLKGRCCSGPIWLPVRLPARSTPKDTGQKFSRWTACSDRF